jgi:lipid A 3-O-deacylase
MECIASRSFSRISRGWLLALLAAASTPSRADPEVAALAIAAGVDVAAAVAFDAFRGDEPNRIAVEVGGFDVVKNVQRAAAVGGEYRPGHSLWWELRPLLGVGITSDKSIYGYGGIRIATYWGERVVVAPSFAVGAYARGDGKDLGSPAVVGRFGLDLEIRLDNGVYVGAAYHHMSNGKALGQSINPGTEVVGVTLSFPMP